MRKDEPRLLRSTSRVPVGAAVAGGGRGETTNMSSTLRSAAAAVLARARVEMTGRAEMEEVAVEVVVRTSTFVRWGQFWICRGYDLLAAIKVDGQVLAISPAGLGSLG